MEKIDYCFLILHYKDAEMTRQTISSILSLSNLKSYRIVIVDNASPDQSGYCLREGYKDNANIFLLEMAENSGFSKGNNFGYRFIKEKFSPRYIICSNNDVLFTQKDFLDKLERVYTKIPFYVCGPDIYIPWRDWHSNPLSDRTAAYTLNDVVKEIKYADRLIITCKKIFSIKIFKLYLIQKARKYKIMQKIYKLVRILKNETGYKNLQENIVLRGACLIFDERFVNKEDKLFEPETFLYGEEQLLYMRCQRNRWNILYCPEMIVDHMHEGNSKLADISYREFCEYMEKKVRYQRDAYCICKSYIQSADQLHSV